MSFGILCICLLVCLLISEPLTVSAQGHDGVRIYIRLIFFGMILSRTGHTERKKQTKRRKSQSRTKGGRDPALTVAIRRALRYLLPRATLIIDYAPLRTNAARSPVHAGVQAALYGVLFGTLSSVLERVEATPIPAAAAKEDTSFARATLRASLLDVLIGAGLFASTYIRRKNNAWQKRK